MTKTRAIALNGSEIQVKLNLLTNEIIVSKGEIPLAKKLLWKPTQRIRFSLGDRVYTLKATLFPINSVALFDGKTCILKEVFPRYRTLSLISFGIGLLKKAVLTVAMVFS